LKQGSSMKTHSFIPPLGDARFLVDAANQCRRADKTFERR
jgi:hypothetical protein